MIKLSFTEFVDISAKNGMSKITNISKVKNKPEYSPASDYYKGFRDHIIDVHKHNLGKDGIKDANKLTRVNNRLENYDQNIKGYRTFWGRKEIHWFEPPHNYWTHNNLSISINPELGLKINNVNHVVKLYFKKDPLSKLKTEISLFLMHQSLPQKISDEHVTYCILDVRNHRLIKADSFKKNILSALIGESSYISSVWDTIE